VHNANGSLDTTFHPGVGLGTGGGVITGIWQLIPYSGLRSFRGSIQREIVVAGVGRLCIRSTLTCRRTQLVSASLALARYTTTDNWTPTSGTNGIVITTSDEQYLVVSALAIQSDGKIVAAGNSAVPQRDDVVNNFAVARYLAQIEPARCKGSVPQFEERNLGRPGPKLPQGVRGALSPIEAGLSGRLSRLLAPTA